IPHMFFVNVHMVGDDVCIYPCSFHIMRIANYRALYHAIMHVDGIFHLGCAYAVPAYVHYIVHAPGYAVVAILIPQAAITCKIFAGVSREVSLLTALMVAPGGTYH